VGRSGFAHEQIINKLRAVEVLLSQGGSVREASSWWLISPWIMTS
jgi:hypothetical protein